MQGKENVLLVYGNRDQRRNYRRLIGRIEDGGRRVLPLVMDWSITDPEIMAVDIEEQVAEETFGTMILHSYGAVHGLVYARRLAERPEPPQPFPQIAVVSQSSRFRSDIYGAHRSEVVGYIKAMHNGEVPSGFRKNRITRHVEPIRTQLTPAEVDVYVGGQEIKGMPIMMRRATNTARLFGTNVHIIPGAPHTIDESDAYIDAIVKQVERR